MYIKDLGFGVMDWVELAKDRDRCRALLNVVMNLQVVIFSVYLLLAFYYARIFCSWFL